LQNITRSTLLFSELGTTSISALQCRLPNPPSETPCRRSTFRWNRSGSLISDHFEPVPGREIKDAVFFSTSRIVNMGSLKVTKYRLGRIRQLKIKTHPAKARLQLLFAELVQQGVVEVFHAVVHMHHASYSNIQYITK